MEFIRQIALDVETQTESSQQTVHGEPQPIEQAMLQWVSGGKTDAPGNGW